MITKVYLKNWRSHLETNMNFCEGTNALIGIIGSGKTSVMDAICFALFGTFPLLKGKKLQLSDIIMKKPKQQRSAEVSVALELDGSEFTIKRVIEGNRTTHAELRKDGKLIEAPQARKVTEEVEKILKIDYELYTRAIYSEQNALDMFLTIPKGQRMQKIDQLLAIYKFEAARATTMSLINRCNSVASEKDQLVKVLEHDESLKKIELIKTEFEQIESTKNIMKKQLAEAQGKETKIYQKMLELRNQSKLLEGVSGQMGGFSILSSATEKDIAKLKQELAQNAKKSKKELAKSFDKLGEKIELAETNIQKQRDQLKQFVQSYTQLNTRLHIQAEKIPKLKEGLKELEKIKPELEGTDIKSLHKKLKEGEKKLKDQGLALQKLVAKIEELKEGLNKLKVATSICPVCESKLTEQKRAQLIAKKESEIEKLSTDSTELKNKLTNLEEENSLLKTKIENLENLTKRIDELKDAEKELDLLIKEQESLKGEAVSYDNKIGSTESKIKGLEKELDKDKTQQERLRQLISKRDELELKNKKLKELEQSIANLMQQREQLKGFSPEALENIENEFKNIISEEKQLEAKIESISSIVIEKQKMLEELLSKQDLIKSYKLEIRKLEGISEQLQLLESALIATQEQLRKDFVFAVNQAMNQIWQDLYPYKDFISIRLGIEGGDYILQLQDRTGWISADGVASGGERSIACLALRIAFALVLAPQLRWVVLDEPTANLDTKSIEDLAVVLRDKVGQFAEQVFLITHDPTLENAVSGYLYRLEREKERDEDTKVVCIAGPVI